MKGKLIALPQSITTNPTSTVTFTCSTNWTVDHVNWERKNNAGNLSNYEPVYFGGAIGTSFKSRYSVTRSIAYTLTVVNVTSVDAGIFKCVDKGGRGPNESTAELNILGEFTSHRT